MSRLSTKQRRARCRGNPRCEECRSGREVRRQGALTSYYWDGKGEDPNRDLFLCSACRGMYCDYWNERWAEYYGGLL